MRRGFCHLKMYGRDDVVSKAISGLLAASAAFLGALGGKRILRAGVTENIRGTNNL